MKTWTVDNLTPLNVESSRSIIAAGCFESLLTGFEPKSAYAGLLIAINNMIVNESHTKEDFMAGLSTFYADLTQVSENYLDHWEKKDA